MTRPATYAHDHDHETPDCAECNEPVGVMEDATVLLKGQFFYNKEEQCAMFLLDPDTEIAIVEINNGLGDGRPQLALVLNKDDIAPVRAIHDNCLGDYDPDAASDEEEDDDEDEEDEDDEYVFGGEHYSEDYEDVKRAIERDHTIWDEQDMLHKRGRS